MNSILTKHRWHKISDGHYRFGDTQYEISRNDCAPRDRRWSLTADGVFIGNEPTREFCAYAIEWIEGDR
jgi:hypothetical protein